MWFSRTKNDLIIEVWEKLDCESVGSTEIEAIESVLEDQFGTQAVESPMVIARLLADEGALLRHSEIMGLYVKRASDRPYEAAFRNLDRITDLKGAAAAIRNLENLRRKYRNENDKAGLRLVNEMGLQNKRAAVELSQRETLDGTARQMGAEIASWFTIWLQTPDVFDDWVALRQRSADFIEKFGHSF
jgi:hypothetical protein